MCASTDKAENGDVGEFGNSFPCASVPALTRDDSTFQGPLES